MSVFLHDKRAAIMIALLEGSKNIQKISQVANCGYSVSVKALRDFENKGFVSSQRNGRARLYSLCQKGGKIAEALSEILYLEGA